MKNRGKLVRDKIPRLAPKARFLKLNAQKYRRALADKLVEEANEFSQYPSLEELADVLEVLRAILRDRKWTTSQLERVRKKKKRDRGGYRMRMFLSYSRGANSQG